MDNLEVMVPDEAIEEEVEIIDDEVTDEVSDDEEAAEEEVSEEEEVQDEGGETGEPDEETQKTVPLAALHQEREKLRTLKKEHAQLKSVVDRLVENTGVRDTRELEERMDNITLQEYIENQGMDERTARVFLMQQKKIAELEKAQGVKTHEAEIQKLKESPFYADIDEVADDVVDYANKKGVTAKEAYNALFAEQRAITLQKEAEQRALKKAAEKQGKKIPALSSSGNAVAPKSKVRLTRAELEFAKAAGLTPSEYAEYKKK